MVTRTGEDERETSKTWRERNRTNINREEGKKAEPFNSRGEKLHNAPVSMNGRSG